MEKINEIFLLGVGHNTAVFIDLAEQSGYTVSGLYHYNDQRTGQFDHGIPIKGSFEDLIERHGCLNKKFLLTMGDNLIRTEIAKKIRQNGGKTPSIVHPSAVVSKFAKIGLGVCISPFSFIQADTTIGNDTIILSGVNISHHNIIGEGCFIAGGSTIGAYTNVGNNVFVGQGVLTISSKVKKIGENSYIGAGSLVTSSVDSDDIIYGRPARSIKDIQ